MTSKNHTNGTSRIAEVCEKMTEYDIIINIQGDEPLIEYEMINSLIETFKENKDLKMAILKHKLLDKEEIENPNKARADHRKSDIMSLPAHIRNSINKRHLVLLTGHACNVHEHEVMRVAKCTELFRSLLSSTLAHPFVIQNISRSPLPVTHVDPKPRQAMRIM